jgi:hypothetical protein
MTRSAVRFIPNPSAVDALLVMAHPWRSRIIWMQGMLIANSNR